MEEKPKKRGRKVGSKNKPKKPNEPPKKRGRKPNEKTVVKENPTFAKDTLDIDDLIVKLNNTKYDNQNHLSITINDYDYNSCDNQSLNYSCSGENMVCWNCIHSFHDIVHGLPINYSNNIFHTIGYFCSVECMARYAVDNYGEDIYNILTVKRHLDKN